MITVFWIFQVFVVLFVHFRIRCWECGINVLWSCLVLGSFALFEVVQVGLF